MGIHTLGWTNRAIGAINIEIAMFILDSWLEFSRAQYMILSDVYPFYVISKH